MALNPFCGSAYYKANSKHSNPKYNLGCNSYLTDFLMFASQTEVCISVRIQSSAATSSSAAEGHLNLEDP